MAKAFINSKVTFILKNSLRILGRVFVAPLLYFGLMQWLLGHSTEKSFFLKWFNLLIAFATLIILVSLRKHRDYRQKDFSNSWDKYVIASEVIGLYIALTIVGISVFSFISYEICSSNPTIYSNYIGKPNIGSFINFYAYETLDMIPILDILKTLNLSKSISANYGLSSWLLLIYKCFFIFLVIDGFKDWKKQFTGSKTIK